MIDATQEEWRPIDGVPYYEVSSFGRVRSLDRISEFPRKGALVKRALKGRVLSPHSLPKGYMFVSLGADKKEYVHRLVARAFVPGDFAQEVNHKDGETGNNRDGNLEWVTRSENHLHAYRELGRKPTKTIPVVVGGVRYSSQSEAARAIGSTSGKVGSARLRGGTTRGLAVVEGN